MPAFVGYMLLFAALAVFFVFIHLVMGRFLRPVKPDADKLTIYECGEPTIGSAWIQFDLRYYVVALLFVIFDVEVAFFFPWAVVFGQANAMSKVESAAARGKAAEFNASTELAQSELMRVNPNSAAAIQAANTTPPEPNQAPAPRRSGAGMGGRSLPQAEQVRLGTSELAWIAFYDILVFFGVLLVGFAYLWKRGDINWVRSIAAEKEDEAEADAPPPQTDSISSLKTIVDGSLQTVQTSAH